MDKNSVRQAPSDESTMMELLFSQSLTGMFFMMLDEPVVWDDSVDKETVMDYVFAHQRITHANQAFLDQYGMVLEEMLGTTPNQLYAHDLIQGRAVWTEFFNKGRLHVDTDERRADGTQIWILGDYICMYDSHGRIIGHFGMQIDITDRKRSEERIRSYQILLEEKKYLIESMLEKAPLGIWLRGIDRKVLFANKFVVENFNQSQQELEICHKTDQEVFQQYDLQTYEETITFKDDSKHILETMKTRVFNDSGDLLGILGIGVDITKRKAVEEALRKSEEKYRLITEQTADVIWVLELENRSFSYISPSIKQLIGYTADEVISLGMKKIVVGASYRKIKALEEDVVRNFLENPNLQTTHILEIQHYCKTGILVWVEASFRLRFNERNQIEVVGVSRNIEERKKNEQEVLYLSYHDQLTGLYNRRFYERELPLLDTEQNLPITLIVADVNGLKLTNDVFGHQSGDTLLKIFASVLQKVCRPQDVAVRMGGDEFVLFLPQTDLAYTQALVENIKQTIAKERVARASVSVSFGCRTKTDSSESLSMVFRQAEDAMYSHKFLESNQHKLETIGLITSSMYEKGVSEYRHGERVRELCIKIGEALQLDCHSIHDLGVAGLLHDIGKIGIDAHLIDKQGPLDEFEWQEIKRHAEIGYSILSSVHEYVNIAGYVLSHHERIDGKGYPRGLKGEEIPLQARVLAVANAYDSMTQERRYKERLDMVSASQELQKHVDTQFDMVVTRVFVEKVLELSWNY